MQSRTEFIRSQRPRARTVNQPGHAPRGPALEGLPIHAPLQIGKYLVSPLTRLTDGGRFAASVSIRSGSGTMTHDRVMRFVPVFDTSDQATRFATVQALAWIDQRHRPAESSTISQE